MASSTSIASNSLRRAFRSGVQVPDVVVPRQSHDDRDRSASGRRPPPDRRIVRADVRPSRAPARMGVRASRTSARTTCSPGRSPARVTIQRPRLIWVTRPSAARVLQPGVDPGSALAGGGHQVLDRAAARRARSAGRPRARAPGRPESPVGSSSSVGRPPARRSSRGRGVEVRPFRGVPGGDGGDVVVVDAVGAGAAGGGVFGGGDEELAGGVEGVGGPAGGEHALAEDEVDVAAFPDAQADADVHLGADGAGAHGLLRRPLGGGEQGHGRRPGRGGRSSRRARSPSGDSSASSAYSSMTTISAGAAGVGCHSREPSAASRRARDSRTATASASSAARLGRGWWRAGRGRPPRAVAPCRP